MKRLIDTEALGFTNPHGIAWRPKGDIVIIVDSVTGRVYKIRRGKDRRFGTSDDTVRSFGTFRFGLTRPVGLTYDGVTDRLFIVSLGQRFIVETTMKGRLVRKIDLSGRGSIILRRSCSHGAQTAGDITCT